MKSMIKLTLIATIVGMFASSAWAADTIIFSTSNANPNAGASPIIGRDIGQAPIAAKLYVWVTSDAGDDVTPFDTGITAQVINNTTNYVPNSGAAIGTNYARTADNPTNGVGGSPAVVSFTGAQDYQYVLTGTNPDLTGTDVNGFVRNQVWDSRSQFTLAANANNVSAALITNVNAAVAASTTAGLTATGINRGFALTQTAANVNANPALISGAFLLGELNFDVTNFGNSALAIQKSDPNGTGVGISRGSTVVGDPQDKTNAYTYGSGLFTVRLNGDADGNNTVNFFDFQIWSAHLGQTGQDFNGGDFNGDNIVNFFDFQIWSAHLGQTVPAGGGGLSPVPEPSSLVLLGLGSVVWVARRRYGRK